LEVGSGSFIPGFEDQLLGAVAGEEREIAVTFPGDYQVGELAGKEAKFSVKVNDIKRKELPELDDEFVKEISEFDTLEELKANLENKLTETASAKAEQEFRKTVIQVATDNSSVDIPEVMVESRIDDMLQELDVNLQSRGMSLDKYLEFAKTDVATLRTNYRETALNSIKIDLMLEGVAKAEALEVTKEDLSAELAAMAQSYQVSPEQILKVMHQEGKLSTLKQSVLTKKALELIVAQVEV
jgi:trigger factor